MSYLEESRTRLTSYIPVLLYCLMNVNDSSLLLAISVVKLLEYLPAFSRQLYDNETLLHRPCCSNTK
jgi:hypothetical protein